MSFQLVIFTDLDGCLLNKSDYDWSPSRPVLQTLQRRSIPVVLNSSKTAAEMSQLAEEFGLAGQPFISENGGVIQWNDLADTSNESRQVLGVTRDQIQSVLEPLSKEFRFRTFADLQIDGVMESTGLEREKATLASDRQSTEPLLWDDAEDAINHFRVAVEQAGLTLTKGGRFWHVTGQNSKGTAMEKVTDRFRKRSTDDVMCAGIGDSAIDQSMLNVADYPIGIPAGGRLNVSINPNHGIVATQEGSAGWAEAVTLLLQRFDLKNDK